MNVQTAVIKESLRVGVGAVTPLPRVVGPGDAHISGVRVPPGVCRTHIAPTTPDRCFALDGGRERHEVPAFQQRYLSRSAQVCAGTMAAAGFAGLGEVSGTVLEGPEDVYRPEVRFPSTVVISLFSKKNRSLAWCELYLILGNLFRKMDLTLHDTT
jgi:hypothetical protein